MRAYVMVVQPPKIQTSGPKTVDLDFVTSEINRMLVENGHSDQDVINITMVGTNQFLVWCRGEGKQQDKEKA